jgi:hypothetical protein
MAVDVSADATPAGSGENRADVVLGTSLAFGIAATLVVILRISYRASKRLINASDWCIIIAAVSIIMIFDSKLSC